MQIHHTKSDGLFLAYENTHKNAQTCSKNFKPSTNNVVRTVVNFAKTHGFLVPIGC